MPWDYFCPTCSSVMEGNMSDGDEMEKEMADFSKNMRGKLLKCNSCKTVHDFDSFKILDEDEVKKSNKEVVLLYN